MSKRILINILLIIASAQFFLMRSDYWDLLKNGFFYNVIENNFEAFHDTLLLFPIALLFSIISTMFPHKVFISWFSFASISIPIISIVAFVISLGLHHENGGFINIEKDIDISFILLLYVFFVLGSLVQIWRGYRSGKQA